MSTFDLLLELHVAIAPLPTPADRAWAWAYAGHQIAAAELGQTPAFDPIPEAVWAMTGLHHAMDDLADAGAIPSPAPIPGLTRDQAHVLLPAVLDQVIAAVAPTAALTPAQVVAFQDVHALAADAYAALVEAWAS